MIYFKPLLCLSLCLFVLAGCGIRPNELVPPSQVNEEDPEFETDSFPLRYPDPNLY